MTTVAYKTKGGETVDEICWAQYGVTAGAVEYVLENNPGLCAAGEVLPADLVIRLPDLPKPQTDNYTSLWS